MPGKSTAVRCLRILTPWSVRAKILLLLSVVILSAFGAVIGSGLLERRHCIESAKHCSLLLVQSLAAQQKQIQIETKDVLGRLARSPEVQTLNAQACNVLLRKLNSVHPYYSVLEAITPDGNLFASSEPFEAGSVNISNRKDVMDAMRSHDFSAGGYSLGRVTGVGSIHYAYPVLDLSRHLVAVVIAGFSLKRYAEFLARANLPSDSVVVITDYKGIRLYRSPKSEAAMAGRPIPRETFKHMSGALDEGVFEGIGGDGTYRIDAFKRLRLRQGLPPYLYMMVGIAKAKLLEGPSFMFFTSLLIVGIAAFVAVVLVWFLSNFPSKVD